MMRRHSGGWRKPERTFRESTRASAQIRRCTSCSLDISRLKISAGRRISTAAWAARLSANAVLPVDGRPAMITKSDR